MATTRKGKCYKKVVNEPKAPERKTRFLPGASHTLPVLAGTMHGQPEKSVHPVRPGQLNATYCTDLDGFSKIALNSTYVVAESHTESDKTTSSNHSSQTEELVGAPAVLSCGLCNMVLGDSLQVCGEARNLNSIVCLRVTKDVEVKEKLDFGIQGRLAGCAYKALHCVGCNCFVGLVLHSTPQSLSTLRNLFLLHKENINCYILKTNTMRAAANVSFEQNSIMSSVLQLNEQLSQMKKRLLLAEDRVASALTEVCSRPQDGDLRPTPHKAAQNHKKYLS
ncbi:MS18B protein, partial [Amia calva]|nr:MS18B protein [Amia calva]